MENILKNPVFKKVVSIGALVLAGIVGVSGELEKQRAEKEKEELEARVADLESKIK